MKLPSTHPCAGLPKAAITAFNAFASGREPKASAATLGLLVERGLFERSTRYKSFNDGLPPSEFHVYSISYAHHIQWCEWAVETRRYGRKRRNRREPDQAQPSFL